MNNSHHGKSDFLDRFQGKTSVIAKDGHLGIVERTGQPIAKPQLISNSGIDQQSLHLSGAGNIMSQVQQSD